MSWFAIEGCPDVGGTIPHRARNVVFLPAPFGPTNPRIWPGATVKLRSLTVAKPF